MQNNFCGFLNGDEIARMQARYNILSNFVPHTENLIHNGYMLPSHGLSVCTYDLRLDKTIKCYVKNSNTNRRQTTFIDPADPTSYMLVEKSLDNGYYIMRPGEFILAKSIESFNMPNFLAGCVLDKSTYARFSISAYNTFIDPGFKGDLTIELVNNNPNPVKLYVGSGIVQVLFFYVSPCYKTYSGKYQEQQGVMGPILQKDGKLEPHKDSAV